MKGKKHNAEQIIKKLREADAMLAAGKSIGQACQALGIRRSLVSTATGLSICPVGVAIAIVSAIKLWGRKPRA
jgi:hypothetical protein